MLEMLGKILQVKDALDGEIFDVSYHAERLARAVHRLGPWQLDQALRDRPVEHRHVQLGGDSLDQVGRPVLLDSLDGDDGVEERMRVLRSWTADPVVIAD